MSKEDLIEFLKENLKVRIETCFNEIRVSLLIGDDVISNDYDYVRGN